MTPSKSPQFYSRLLTPLCYNCLLVPHPNLINDIRTGISRALVSNIFLFQKVTVIYLIEWETWDSNIMFLPSWIGSTWYTFLLNKCYFYPTYVPEHKCNPFIQIKMLQLKCHYLCTNILWSNCITFNLQIHISTDLDLLTAHRSIQWRWKKLCILIYFQQILKQKFN